MLVLARKPGERIVIGEGDSQVVVTVLKTDDGKVRLGFEAPPEVVILRAELIEETQAAAA